MGLEAILEFLPPGFRQRKAALDSNLLLLYLAAITDISLLSTFSRIKSFDEEDVLLLQFVLGQFRSVVTTPHVLTEVSNLANKLHGDLRRRYYENLRDFAAETKEIFQDSQILAANPEFVTFGITDCALSDLSDTHTVITAEHKLSGHLKKLRRSVINFNNLRGPRLLRD